MAKSCAFPLGAMGLAGVLLAAGSARAESDRTAEFCSLPLCREADGLLRSKDFAGAWKAYRYILDEVDVDEKVVRKPLLYFVIAELAVELKQPQPALEALKKYQQYVSAHPDAELPALQKREDIDRLEKNLNNLRLAAATGESEPAPAGLSLLGNGPKLPPAIAAEAERHIAAGIELHKRGLHRSAHVELDEAYELSRRPELLWNIAELLLKQGQPRESISYFERYLKEAPDGTERKAATETLLQVRRELALEADANRTAAALRYNASANKTLRRTGVGLLVTGAGLVVVGIGLGIGAAVTGHSVESADRFDPSLAHTGQSLQTAGISFDVVGALSLGVGAICFGVARSREAALPANAVTTSGSAPSAILGGF